MDKPLLIDKTIKKIEFMFLCIGINIKTVEKKPKDRYRSWSIYIFNSLCINVDILGAIVWFYKGVIENKTFTELTYVTPCLIYSLLCDVKTVYIIINESTTDKLINNIRQLEIKQKTREKDPEAEKIIEQEHNYLNRIVRIISASYIFVIIFFGLTPLMLSVVKYYQTNKVELLLPFLILYPFDPFDLRYYPWVYLQQIWSEVVVVLGICAVDCMFYIFCMYLRMQFHLLSFYIERLIPPEPRSGVVHDREAIKSNLAKLIQWHQQLISCVELLEILYTRSTLFNFIASSVVICLTGFNVTAIDDVAFVLTFFSFLLMSLFQIFLLCFFGDLLIESGMLVGDAIYNCRWYLADTALGRSLLLIITRSQTPCKLTASSFADVNLKAFMKIGSTAWSYFALLQTLYADPDA